MVRVSLNAVAMLTIALGGILLLSVPKRAAAAAKSPVCCVCQVYRCCGESCACTPEGGCIVDPQ
jgi:hypothetical protein